MSRGAILVVDDEAELRSSACEWLSLSGFSVARASIAAIISVKLIPCLPNASGIRRASFS